MICESCNNTHEGSFATGRFCSRSCANSRGPRTEDFKRKVREKATGRPSPRKVSMTRSCLLCESTTIKDVPSNKAKFCCWDCYKEWHSKKRTPYQEYKIACQFRFSVKDYPELFDLELIEQHGWYAAANRGKNLNGISRDHRVSVKDGFQHGYDPYYISHPINCQLMRHQDNQKKRAKSSVSFDDLVREIEEWTCGRDSNPH